MWLIIFTAFSLIAGLQANYEHEPDTHLSPTGLVFTKEDGIIVTGDSWTIVMVINATQHLKNAEELNKHFLNMETEMIRANMTNEIYKEELRRLRFIVDTLLDVNEGITQMLRKNRAKRFLGGAVRSLFGAASNSDVQKISHTVSHLQSRINRQEAFQEYQMSFMNNLNNQIDENTRKLSMLTTLVENEIEYFKDYTHILDDKIDKIEKKLETDSNLATCFRLLESVGLYSLILSNRLQSGLEMAAQGKLSFSLISAKELHEELLKVDSLIPFGLKWVSSLDIDHMYKYQQVGEVLAIAQDNLILLSLKIPLLSVDRGFDLYHVQSVPIKDEKSGRMLRTQPETDYFIISDDHEFYSLLNKFDVEKCKGQSPMICPAVFSLNRRYKPSCLSAAFLKEKEAIQAYCKPSVLINEHKPIWILDKKNMGWIFSVPKPTRITLNCGKKKTEMDLIGTNILANVSHCSILGQDFKLFRSTEGISYSNGTFSVSNVAKLEPILKEKTVEELTNEIEVDKAVEDLKNEGFSREGAGQSEEINMDMLLARVEENRNPQYAQISSWKIIVFPAFVALIVSVGASYFILYYDKNHTIKGKYPFQRRNRRFSKDGEETDPKEIQPCKTI